MDLSPISPADNTDQTLLSSLLPGRDHVADADTSHSRKRPRLSDEPDSPPHANGAPSNLSDTQITSGSGRPTVLGLPQEQSTDPSEISIMMTGDETTADVHISSFPFLTEQNETPESAATKFAEHCQRKTAPALTDIVTLIKWLDGHLRDTDDEFDAALKHDTISSAIFDLYSDNATFWNQIVSCFHGLIGRCSLSFDEGLTSGDAYTVFENILDKLLRLGERLLHTDVAILKQREARRDSTSSPTFSNSPKHSLHFMSWVYIFTDMAVRPKEFLEPMSSVYRFNIKSLLKQSIERFQHCAMDAMLTLIEHIASRSHNIMSPFATAFPYTNLCHQVLLTKSTNVGSELTSFFGKSARMFEVVYTMTVQNLPQQHLDEHSQRVIEGFHSFLVDMLGALYHAKHISPNAVYDLIMKGIVEHKIVQQELLDPSPNNTSSSSDEFEAHDTIKASLARDDVLDVALLACSLSFLDALMRSSSMDLRNRATEQMGAIVWNTHINMQSGYHRLMQDYMARFILAKDILGYLWGPQSHATLIGRSLPMLAFVATKDKLTKRIADMVWSVSLNLQQPDESQSAFKVLRPLRSHMPSLAKQYFCNKFSDLPLSQFTREAEGFFHDLMVDFLRTSIDGQYEAIQTCIHLLAKIDHSDIPPARQDQLLFTFANLLSRIRSPPIAQESVSLVETCAGPIASMSDDATGYVQALSCIVKQADFSIPPGEVWSRLPFFLCVDELLKYLERVESGDKPFVSSALYCRLDLITYVVTVSDPGAIFPAAEKKLWQHVLGEHALTPQVREVGWHFFVQSFRSGQAELQAFYDRFINQHLPGISPDFVTPETINLFKAQYALQETDLTGILPIGEELVRFGLTVPSDKIAHEFKMLLMESLFRGKAIKHPDLAVENQILVVRKLVAQLVQEGVSATRAAELLLVILAESTQFQEVLERSNQAVPCKVQQAESEVAQDSIRIPIRIHRGNAQPQNRMVTINKSASCSELDAAIASETGFADYTVVTAGQKIDFAEEPQLSIAQRGLQAGNVLIIQKRNTFQSIQEEANKIAEKSIIKGEIVSHSDVLYGLLDGTDTKAQLVLQILEFLKFPGSIRAMIADPETPFEKIFPPGMSLRLRASVEVLSIQLKEQITCGVADEKFLLRGVHLLVNLLCRNDVLREVTDVWRTAETLTELLRERPATDISGQYFEDAAKLTHRMICSIGQFSREITVGRDNNKHYAIRALYQCLLESVLLSDSVCAAFVASDHIVQIQLSLLLTRSDHLRATIPRAIMNAIQDERASCELKAFFSKFALEHLIPTALKYPAICDNAFLVSLAAVSADLSLNTDETLLRTTIDGFAKTLLDLNHLERFGDCFVDKRVSGLVSLLRYCAQILVTQNKPLNLGNIPSQIFKTLLFPILRTDKNLPPILASETRNNLYELLPMMCDNVQTLEDLTVDCENAAGYCTNDQGFIFPGPNGYIRQEGNYAGLANLSQTCYFNSLLQQLFMNIQFRKFIFDTSVVDQKKQTVLVELKLAFASMQDSHDIFYQPDELIKALNIDHTQQDDAHIFFMTLIGQLEESMPDEAAKNTLKAFFRGVNKSQTIGSCKHVSESTDEYFNLSLVVKDKASLEESLEEYTKGATLEGSDKFTCTTCGSGEGVPVDAVQRTAFEHIPDNLVLGLRRFRYETFDGGQKVNDRFDFPEFIDMSKYKLNRLAGIEGSNKPDIFQLVGVVVHQGILTFGHYWSYAAERGRSDAEPLRWYLLEDKNVRLSSIEEVLGETRGGPVPSLMTSLQGSQSPRLRSDNAYVLFYQRVSSINESAQCLATSMSALPYTAHTKVRLPSDLETKITKDNQQKMFILHLFSLSHLEFVRGLTGKLGMIKNVDTSSTISATHKLMSMLLSYYIRVVASFDSEYSPQSVDFTSMLLQKLACSSKESARWVLLAVLPRRDEKDKSTTLVLHYKRAVRLATNRLILACFRYLREHDSNYHNVRDGGDPEGTPNIMADAIQGLIDLRLRLLERLQAVWGDYFELVRHIAELGPNETFVFLKQGVLKWCLEVLLIKNKTELQKQHPDVMRMIADNSRRLNHASLVNCIYGLLRNFVNLRRPAALDTNDRWTDSQMLLLTAEEHEYLLTHSNTAGNLLVELCMYGISFPSRIDWREWPTVHLIVLLTNADRVSQELYDDAVRSLIFSLKSSADDDSVAEAVLACLLERNLKSTTEEDIFKEIKAVLFCEANQRTHPAVWGLIFIVKQVYKAHPQMIMHHLASIVRFLLTFDNRSIEKHTRDWLENEILVQDVLAKPFVSDQVRLCRHKLYSMKELLQGLGTILNTAIHKSNSCRGYEYMISAYGDCSKYLYLVSSSLDPELEAWLKSEAPDIEADTEIDTVVQELFDEVEGVDDVLSTHENLRVQIREWQEEYSISDAALNSNVVEIDDDSDNEAMVSDESLSDVAEFEDEE
ncbi:hypothetical protein QM012_004089 [Aureobasidium pullulans]|uniref:USP domain-containing protein n=1 Tax=Aureobasidium pullulans TaxID=5580 RepID=A0ABR0T7Z6_AURPU